MASMNVTTIDVLGNVSLFDLITSFQSGLPGRIYSYWRCFRSTCIRDGIVPCDEKLTACGELVMVAIQRGDVAMVHAMYTLFMSSPYYRSLPLLQFQSTMCHAAIHDQIEVLEWFHSAERDGITCHSRAAHGAALQGKCEALQWLLTHCHECARGVTVDTVQQAVRQGRLDVVVCLYTLRPQLCMASSMLMTAVQCGSSSLEMIRFLHEKLETPGTTTTTNINTSSISASRGCEGLLDRAAGVGRIELVQYLHGACSAGCTTSAMDQAAANGHLDTLQFLHENRVEGCTVYAMDQAAAQGFRTVVEFLHTHRNEGATSYAMSAAAKNGHLDVVMFLHSNRAEGCSPWALAHAAGNGHLEIVQFLHAHGLGRGWEDSALIQSSRNGHLQVVEFLCERTGVPIGDRIFDARRGAKSAGHEKVVTYLDKQIHQLLKQKDKEQREKIRRQKHAKSKKKRK